MAIALKDMDVHQLKEASGILRKRIAKLKANAKGSRKHKEAVAQLDWVENRRKELAK